MLTNLLVLKNNMKTYAFQTLMRDWFLYISAQTEQFLLRIKPLRMKINDKSAPCCSHSH